MSDRTDYLAFSLDFDAPDIVAVYDEVPLWSAMFGLLLLQHVPLRHCVAALDIGCGTGFPLLELAQRLGTSSVVYGIDPWEAALARAKQKAQRWDVRNVEVHRADAAAMPFPNSTFDLLVSNLGINNVHDPAAVLRECWRVAKPSATIALTINLQGHMQELYDVFESTLREMGGATTVPALRQHIAARTTIAGMTELFAQTGFALSAVHEASTVMRFVDGSALLRHHFIKLGFLDGWKRVVAIDEQEAVFVRFEANLNRLAQAQGELRLTIPMAYIEAKKVQ